MKKTSKGKEDVFLIQKTGAFVLGKQEKIKGRKYCPACQNDVTIIRSHDCLNNTLGISDGVNVITINRSYE